MAKRIKRETAEIDRDELAIRLRARIEELGLSIRTAAPEIGCSAATLGRLVQGSAANNVPETVNIVRAVSWLGMSLSEFENGPADRESSLDDVQVHLRGLKGISDQTADAIFAMVKAAYDSASTQTKRKRTRR